MGEIKTVNFVLPRPTAKIVGGFKVVYDYANYLVDNGWNVIVTHDCEEIGTRFNLHIPFIKNAVGRYLKHKEKWVRLDERIKIHYISTIEQLSAVDTDIVMATAVNTVNMVWMSYKNKAVKKAYFIQGHENWDISDISVNSTYRLPMAKITISKWLYHIVAQVNGTKDLYLCRNGLDLDKLRVMSPIEERKNDSICFMYHEDFRKGVDSIRHILPQLREKYPELKVSAFGAFEKPEWLDDSVDYVAYANADDLVSLYNQSAIFLCSSLEEGFGLTGAESMACGCTLLTTKTNGSREYCDASNSILIEPNDKEALFEKACYLIDNPEVRIRLAQKGNKDIQNLSITNARKQFSSILNEILEG